MLICGFLIRRFVHQKQEWYCKGPSPTYYYSNCKCRVQFTEKHFKGQDFSDPLKATNTHPIIMFSSYCWTHLSFREWSRHERTQKLADQTGRPILSLCLLILLCGLVSVIYCTLWTKYSLPSLILQLDTSAMAHRNVGTWHWVGRKKRGMIPST